MERKNYKLGCPSAENKMVAIWLMGANYLSRHPLLARSIDRFGHFVTPVVLILLGLYILFENKSFTLLNYR